MLKCSYEKSNSFLQIKHKLLFELSDLGVKKSLQFADN